MRGAMWIGGAAQHGDRTEQITNPFDGSVVGEASVGESSHVEAAMAAAVSSFRRAAETPVYERIEILEKAVQILREHGEELAQLMRLEGGKPIQLARGEVSRAMITFSLGIDVARREQGAVETTELSPSGVGRFCLHHRVPRGPVAAIAPFNFPLNLVAHKLSPSIAVGTSVVLKPAAQCPLTALRFCELLHERGIPEGWINVLHMRPEVAQAMVEDQRMRVLSFTGSAKVGWALKALAGEKQVCLELGGNAPLIVDEGTSVSNMMDRMMVGAWAHAGQVCIKTQRVLVHHRLFEEFLEVFKSATAAVKAGDPAHEDTLVGPMIDEASRDRVLQWVDEAKGDGATVQCGGDFDGNVISPTILTGVKNSMKVVREEVFGPVTTVESFHDFEDALEVANSGPYGLHAGVFTPHIDRAMHAFRRLQFGGVMINDVPTFRTDNVPYGGSRSSGMGREGVRFAAEDFTEPKMLILRNLSSS